MTETRQRGYRYFDLIMALYVFKVGLEAAMILVTYQITGYLKRTENEDVYDVDTDFNPFKLGMT